jgi:hypothetical protein
MPTLYDMNSLTSFVVPKEYKVLKNVWHHFERIHNLLTELYGFVTLLIAI